MGSLIRVMGIIRVGIGARESRLVEGIIIKSKLVHGVMVMVGTILAIITREDSR